MLVADFVQPQTQDHQLQGVGRLNKIRGTRDAEFAVLVGDRFQGQGLGTVLLERLLQVGRDEKIQRISGDVLPENTMMRRICEKLGFQVAYTAGDPVIKVFINL